MIPLPFPPTWRAVLAGVLLLAPAVHAQTTVAGWDFDPLTGGSGNYGASPLSATTSDSNVTVVGLARGPGVATTGTAAGNAWGGVDWDQGTSLATAITNGHFATFTITPNATYKFSLSSISAYNVRRSSSGPATGQWQYSLDGTNFVDIGSAITWGAVTTASGNPKTAIDLSGITELQDVLSSTTVTFRVVNYGATGTGTWYLNDPSGAPGLDFSVAGTVELETVNPNAPTISSFTPTTGWGGTVVAITGTNLTGATDVSFNNQPASGFTVNSDTEIAAIAPVGVTTGKISVTTPEGSVSSVDDFLAVNPNTLTVAVTLSSVLESAANPATTGTITRSGPLSSSPVTVTLTSSDTTEITVPATVEFAADQLVANFDITAVDDTIPDGTQIVTLTATNAGYIQGSTTIDVTDDATDTWPLVVNQYYEGAGSDKYIEIKNISASPVQLSDYRLTTWTNAGAENWKTNTGTPTNNNTFADFSLPAGATYLIKASGAAIPSYAASGANATMAAVNFNGNDSVVLYHGAAQAIANIVDAVTFAVHDPELDGKDKTFYRISNAAGYNLTAGSSVLDFPSVWASDKTLADVASAVMADEWYLKPYSPPVPPSLDTFTLGGGSATTVTGRVSISYTATGGLPAEYRVSESMDFTGASWLPMATGLTFNLSAGPGMKTVYFQLQNTDGPSGVLSNTIEVVAPVYAPAVLITQYYDPDLAGASNKYIELTNISASPVDLTGWTLVRWGNQDAELYKVTGAAVGSASATVSLTAIGTLTPGQTVVLANSSAAALTPPAAFTSGVINHNGNDSVAIYSGAYGTETLVDVIGFTDAGNEGADKSFVRLTNSQGFGFAAGSKATDFPSVWQEVSLAAVAAATSTENAYLGTYPGSGGGGGSPYELWIDSFFEGETDPAIIGFNADPDKDGIPNGIEALIGGEPDVPGVFGTTGITKAGATFSFLYTQANPIPAGVTAGYEWSTDLTNWQQSDEPFGGVTVTISDFIFDDGTETTDIIQVDATVSAGTANQLFVRVVAND